MKIELEIPVGLSREIEVMDSGDEIENCFGRSVVARVELDTSLQTLTIKIPGRDFRESSVPDRELKYRLTPMTEPAAA